MTAQQIVLRLKLFSARSPPANENKKRAGMWSRATLIWELQHACATILNLLPLLFPIFREFFLFSTTGAVSSRLSDPGLQPRPSVFPCFSDRGKPFVLSSFYIKQTNINYKKPFLNFLIKNIVISNFYLNLKKVFYPKKLIKLIFNI